MLDDFAPMTQWPPVYGGEPDHARLFWLEHPRLRTAEELRNIVVTHSKGNNEQYQHIRQLLIDLHTEVLSLKKTKRRKK